MAKTYNLASLNLAKGTHIIQCKAKAEGYRTSAFSTSATFVVYGVTGTGVGVTLDGSETYSSTVAQTGSKSITLAANGTTYKLPDSIYCNGVEIAAGTTVNNVYYYRASNTAGSITYMTAGRDIDLSVYGEEIEQNIIVGFTGLANKDSALTLTDAIASVGMWSTSQNGNYTSVINPLDSYFPFKQIKEFTDGSGNVFVRFPKMFVKFESNSSGALTGFKCANYQPDGTYFTPQAFYKPNTATANQFFALGKYEASGSTSKIYSKTGQSCLVSATRSQFRSAARAYGNSSNYYNGYQQLDAQMWSIYNLLAMMYFRTKNIQQVFGGRTSYSGTGHTWSTATVTGTCDPITTLSGWNTSTDCVKILGVENPYGNIGKWMDGLVFNGSSIYSHSLAVNYSDSTSGATELGFTRPQNNGVVSALTRSSAIIFPKTLNGDSDFESYFGDRYIYGSTGTIPAVGYGFDAGAWAGLMAISTNSTTSGTSAGVGGRLAYRPT